jgi:hypothetical protein
LNGRGKPSSPIMDGIRKPAGVEALAGLETQRED